MKPLNAIPKIWHDTHGRKRHTVSDNTTDGETIIIISKHWLNSKRRWQYSAETLKDVQFIIHLTKKAG